LKTIQTPKLIDYTFLIFLSAIWGSAFVGIEIALTGFHPFLVAFGRIALAALFLFLIVLIQKRVFPKDKKTWYILILIGFLNNAVPFYLISWGQQFISPSTASVMLAVGPLIALVLSHYITDDEKFTIFKLIGVILGFVGVFILLGEDFFTKDSNSFYGKLTMLLAVLGYISSGFLIRKISYVDTVVCSSSMFLTATFMMIPVLFFISYEQSFLENKALIAIVYLAIVPTALASLLRVKLVQKIGVQFMSQVAYLIPMFAIFWSWLIFNEIPSKVVWIALLFILAGVFMRHLKIRKANE